MNKVIYTIEELKEEINRYHGKTNCLISLYSFTKIDSHIPDWTTAIIDKILVECNFKEAKKISSVLPTEIWYIGDNKFNILVGMTGKSLRELAILVNNLIEKKCNLKVNINYYLNKQILCPGTLNLSTERYVTLVKKEDIKKGLEHIDNLSKKE